MEFALEHYFPLKYIFLTFIGIFRVFHKKYNFRRHSGALRPISHTPSNELLDSAFGAELGNLGKTLKC